VRLWTFRKSLLDKLTEEKYALQTWHCWNSSQLSHSELGALRQRVPCGRVYSRTLASIVPVSGFHVLPESHKHHLKHDLFSLILHWQHFRTHYLLSTQGWGWGDPNSKWAESNDRKWTSVPEASYESSRLSICGVPIRCLVLHNSRKKYKAMIVLKQLCSFGVWDSVPLCSLGCLGNQRVSQAGLELMILLPLPPKC
jgi:hypothetical protein